MIPRQAEATLRRLEKGFPVLCITGPRQSGKRTLAKACYPDKPYLSLDDPDVSLLAREDPRGLLGMYREGLILDEIQVVPELFTYLKTAVDSDPRPGKYIVTGSQQFKLLAGITESLAGRAAFINLLPFSSEELDNAGLLPEDPFKVLVSGFYPPLYDREVLPYDWYTNYISAYVERDVRSILNVKDLSLFQTFLKMCASRTGQILNVNSLALDCGVSHNTARSWLSVLETSGIIYLLKPYYKNYGKRLVKSPKLYFIDAGLNARLLGIKTPEDLFMHPNRGNIFESFVISELLKKRYNAGYDPDMYFWRDNTGTEIDIILEDGNHLQAVEIKSGKTFSESFISGLQLWMKYSKTRAEHCAVVYAGTLSAYIKSIAIIPWNKAGTLAKVQGE
jgi:hypothetical protein